MYSINENLVGDRRDGDSSTWTFGLCHKFIVKQLLTKPLASYNLNKVLYLSHFNMQFLFLVVSRLCQVLPTWIHSFETFVWWGAGFSKKFIADTANIQWENTGIVKAFKDRRVRRHVEGFWSGQQTCIVCIAFQGVKGC